MADADPIPPARSEMTERVLPNDPKDGERFEPSEEAEHPVEAKAPRTPGRWSTRILSTLGVALIVVSLSGWWLSTKVLSDDGFADVIATSSQQQPVRDYIGQQASIRLAKSSNFVSGARPVVSTAISSAIATPAVKAAVRAFALNAHAQIFRVNNARRVDLDASQTSLTVRTTLQSLDPVLAGKLPAGVLNSAATVAQSPLIDFAARASVWIRWLYLPIGLFGAFLLVYVVRRSSDRTHAVRYIGLTMTVAGAFPIGLGFATPIFAAIGSSDDPGRGAAVGAFIHVLLDRLVHAGWAMMLVGLMLALAPGRDGGHLEARRARLEQWVASSRADRTVQATGAGVLIALAALLITRPGGLLRALELVVGVGGLYVGIVAALRTSGLLVVGQPSARIRRRQWAGVGVAVLVVMGMTTALTSAVVAATKPSHRADAQMQGCNGYVELCSQRLNQIVWPASHNAMSSAAYNFYTAEHTMSVREQLDSGIKVLLLDVYYGYEDHGIVRTNLAGGADQRQLSADIGKAGLDELNRLGALTGTVDTSGKKKDIYFCHDYCELGAVKAVTVLKQIREYLDRNLTDVLILDFEDYVLPADLRKVMQEAGLYDRVYIPDLSKPLPTLLDIVNPAENADDNPRRVITTAERHGGVEKWLPGSYQLMQETPFTFPTVASFNCQPNRGGSSNPLLLVNHWLRAGQLPDPVAAAKTNSAPELQARMQQCIAVRKRLPNVLAVDFTNIGDVIKVTAAFNAAVAQVTGASEEWNRIIAALKLDPDLTAADVAEINGFHRLDRMTDGEASQLLGAAVNWLRTPADIVANEDPAYPKPLTKPEGS